MIRRYKLGREVEVHKRTLEYAELSIIGPDAPPLAGEREHDNARVELGGKTAIAVTTDVGTDIFCAAEDKSLITRPSTARLSSICTVTSIFIPAVAATMSPKPTVANTVTVKYSAVTWSRI